MLPRHSQMQPVPDRIVAAFETSIGGSLTGVYLHGSLAMGCYNPGKSDLDFIIVVSESLTLTQKKSVLAKINSIIEEFSLKGIEFSVVLGETALHPSYPAPYELHFSTMYIERYRSGTFNYESPKEGDPDLSAHFAFVRRRGVALYGKSIEGTFGPIPVEHYLSSLTADTESALATMKENPTYLTLNLCRVLGFLETGKLMSKKEGGIWAIDRGNLKHLSVVTNALDTYCSTADVVAAPNFDHLTEFSSQMIELIRARKPQCIEI